MAETMGDRFVDFKYQSQKWSVLPLRFRTAQMLPYSSALFCRSFHFKLDARNRSECHSFHGPKILTKRFNHFHSWNAWSSIAASKRCVPACRAMVRVVTLLGHFNLYEFKPNATHVHIGCFPLACVFVCASVDRYTTVCVRSCVHVCPRVGSTMNSVPFEEEKKHQNEWEPRAYLKF